MNPIPEQPVLRNRDRAREEREQTRFRMLQAVYERAGARCEVPVFGLELGAALGLPREETFRAIYELAHRGFLSYRGAGPKVGIAEKGIAYLEREAGRRRSVRDG